MSANSKERQRLRSFILENYLFTDDESMLDDSTSFMVEGVLDSTGILEVIMFLEDELQISVNDEDMIPENLDSIDNLLAYIERKR